MSGDSVSVPSVPQSVDNPTPLAGNAKSDYFQLFADETGIPQANELLSLKILKDANPTAFASIAADETKWLAVAYGLLKRDPYLQVQLKGRGVKQAMKLANLLKQKAEERHFTQRIDGVVNTMVDARFKESGWQQLRGIQPKKIKEFLKPVDVDGDTVMVINPDARGYKIYGSKEIMEENM